MRSKFIEKRNNFISKLVTDYTKVLGTVLDLGCGQADLFRDVTKTQLILYQGVDLNYNGALHNVDNESILTWDTNRVFDTVVLQEVIEHLQISDRELLEFLEKVKRFMHSESILIISVPNYHRLTNEIRFELDLGRKYLDETHYREYIDGEIDSILKNNGFKIVDKFSFILYLPFEKYIGWAIPESVRDYFLKKYPTLGSHFVYVVKKEEQLPEIQSGGCKKEYKPVYPFEIN